MVYRVVFAYNDYEDPSMVKMVKPTDICSLTAQWLPDIGTHSDSTNLPRLLLTS
jgi:hypothetical protein